MTETRRLAAIVSADVAGYSRLMGRDESGTLAALKALRRELVDPAIERHRGRIVKTTGDGLLLEFPSVVDAVRCAVEVQAAMAAATADVAEDRRIAFRIGINLGDIILDGEDIFGDGVNIAARLESVAEPGGIALSRQVHDQVRDRIDAAFEDRGKVELKNIARPVHVFALAGRTIAAAPAPALALPDKPSIAVLPFQNMSGEPEQDYFADGMVEDIITALARFRSLFVIARNSSFTYKGKAADIKQVGRELGVRYVLEGSVRKAGGRIRVTAQLIEAATGNHIWAERYDRTLEDVFAVQEDLTGSIVGAIAPQIEASEKAAALRRAPANLTAYERAARASALIWRGNDKADSATLDMAVEEARRAIAIDPGSVLAFQTVARAQSMKLFLQLADDREKLLHEAWYAAVRAIELDGADPASYAIRAFCTFMSGERERYAEALADARRAHDSNPNDIFNLLILAYIEIRLGEPESALERARLMLRLNPRAERLQDVYNLHAFACFGAARYAEGVEWARRALRDMPSLVPAHSNLVTCLVGMGEIDQARVAFATASALAPGYFRVRLEGQSLYYRPHDRERQVRFLRIAAGLEAPNGGQPAGDTAK